MLGQEGHSENEKKEVKKDFRNTQDQVIVSIGKACGYKKIMQQMYAYIWAFILIWKPFYLICSFSYELLDNLHDISVINREVENSKCLLAQSYKVSF